MNNIIGITSTNFFKQSSAVILSKLTDRLSTNIGYRVCDETDTMIFPSELKGKYFSDSYITLTDITLDYTVPTGDDELFTYHGIQKLEIMVRLTSIIITLLIYPSGIIIIQINSSYDSFYQLSKEIINNRKIMGSKPKTILKSYSQIKYLFREISQCLEIKHILLISEYEYSQIFDRFLDYKNFQLHCEFSKLIELCRKNYCLIFNFEGYLLYNSENRLDFKFTNLQDMKLCIVDDL